jgi:hypothetical protein
MSGSPASTSAGFDDAVNFWRQAIPVAFTETIEPGGTFQRFTNSN